MTSAGPAGTRRTSVRTLLVVATLLVTVGCTSDTSLARLTEARRVTAQLRVQFSAAADAANRAVMADTADASAGSAREAEQLSQAVLQDAERLGPLLTSLRFSDEARLLEEFQGRFTEYRQLDQRILQLAAEGTNLEAQRLAFGPARDAAAAFADALMALTARDATADRWRVQALVNGAVLAAREIQVRQPPHIAEADDDAMTRLETAMAASEADARVALKALEGLVGTASSARLSAARAAFERFVGINAEIVALSRRNTNVRSLALSLNQKRLATAACDESLRALEDALGKRGFSGTR